MVVVAAAVAEVAEVWVAAVVVLVAAAFVVVLYCVSD